MTRTSLPIFLLLLVAAFARAQQRPIDKEFLDAVQSKDFNKINLLLSKGANVNAREPINRYFALQYAINWPDLALVKLLLDKGANVNLADDGGTTALIEAVGSASAEHTAITKLLIERGADIHAKHDAAILRAVREASPEVVQLLLAKGAPVNARDEDRNGNTVLIEAASGGSVETLALLLNAGADLKATNNDGQTALMKAVALDHRYRPATRLPMMELLLNKGADINAKDKNGRTPLLHSVVQYMSEAGGIISHPEVVKLLLERGADINAVDEQGDNALITTVSVWQGPIEIVQLLLSKGINVNLQNKKGATALMVAAEKGKQDVVTLLLEEGADLNLQDAERATALDYAISNGQTEIAKALFSKSAGSRNKYRNEPEMLSAVTNFALLSAASRTNLAEVKAQLNSGADINYRNSRSETALMIAIEYSYGRNDVANLLVEKGADLNAVDIEGNTALMIAIDRNNGEAVEMLLAHKAAVYPRNKEGRSALHIASAGLRKSIVAALLAATPEVTASSAGVDVRGVEVNSRDASGRTPLMLAADNEGFVPDDVMELLLSKGAKIDEPDPQGNTPLMIAAKAGSMSGVEFLLQKGASVNLKNHAGENALKFARQIHEDKRLSNAELVEQRVVAMLLKAGAKE
jgi:uncharacterized protein